MTTRDLIHLLLRRWYVVAAGVSATLLVALVTLRPTPIYFTQFDVVLLPPPMTVQNNNLRTDPFGLAALAGVLVEQFNRGHHPVDMSTTLTTLYGEGDYDGYRVRMRNAGSQWQRVYPDPAIDVQVVNPDSTVVREQARMIVTKLGDILERRQAEAGAPPSLRVTLRQASSDPVIGTVVGNRMRAAGALALLGAATTTVTAVCLDRFVRRRRSRRHADGPAYRLIPRS